MTELKRGAKQSAQNLRTLESNLRASFGPVEDETLSKQLDEGEVNAHKFFVRMVDTHTGTISEIGHMFNMCVDAHEKNNDRNERVERQVADITKMFESMKRDNIRIRNDHSKLQSAANIIAFLWSGKAVAASIISAIALVFYNVYLGDWS